MILELYIQKQFLFELSQRNDKDNEVVYDFIYFFLKKVRGVKVTIDITLDELKLLCDSNKYFLWLTEINPSIQLNPRWAKEIEACSQHGCISKLFLLSNEIACDPLEQRFGLLYINNQNLIKKWAPVRIMRDMDVLSVNEMPAKPYWEQLADMAHPFNNLLIFDNYGLSDKSNQRLDDNLIPLLRYFISNYCSSKNHMNTVILSSQIMENEKQLSESEKIQKVHTYVSKSLPERVDMEVIKYDDTHTRIKAAMKEHDRFLFTNYIYLESGSGFCIYDNKGGVKNHTKITIRSIFKNANRNIIEHSLKNLTAYVNELKQDVKILPPLTLGAPIRKVIYCAYHPTKSHPMINYSG